MTNETMSVAATLKWADTWGWVQYDQPTGDSLALMTLAEEVRRLEEEAKLWEERAWELGFAYWTPA